MKALSRAMLLLCLFVMPVAFSQGKQEKKLGCIGHITQQDKVLRLKGARLITQMMNHSYFIRTYVGSIPLKDGKSGDVVIFIMAVKSAEAPSLPTRIKCTRETDGQQFDLLQIIFPLREEKA